MSDDCVIYWTEAAQKELGALAKRDSRRAAVIRKLAQRIEENGWILSTRSEVLKVLRNDECIGEIRDVGGGYRMLMFWHHTDEGREIWICRIVPKQTVVSRRRLNEICDAVAQVRKRFYEEEPG